MSHWVQSYVSCDGLSLFKKLPLPLSRCQIAGSVLVRGRSASSSAQVKMYSFLFAECREAKCGVDMDAGVSFYTLHSVVCANLRACNFFFFFLGGVRSRTTTFGNCAPGQVTAFRFQVHATYFIFFLTWKVAHTHRVRRGFLRRCCTERRATFTESNDTIKRLQMRARICMFVTPFRFTLTQSDCEMR